MLMYMLLVMELLCCSFSLFAENYRLEITYENNLIIKLVLVCFTSNYFIIRLSSCDVKFIVQYYVICCQYVIALYVFKLIQKMYY